MEKPFEYVKSVVVNYKLDHCCWVAPVRIGLIFTGYFNIFVSLISLVGTANESFPPTIVQVQAMILDDNATKPIPLLAYATDMGFSVLLLCAIYRKDIVLMRVYMRYCIFAIIMSLLVYSIVIAAIDVLIQIAIILGTAYQFYVLLLVRSAIVELRAEKKQYELPTLVMSSIIKEKETKDNDKNGDIKEDNKIEKDGKSEEVNVENVPETSNGVKEAKKEFKETKLETVEEHPKE